MTDISLVIAVVGCCLSIATFYVGRQSASKSDGRSAGALETDLRYIKERHIELECGSYLP